MRKLNVFALVTLAAASGVLAHADTLSTFSIQGSSVTYGMAGDTNTLFGATTIDITTGLVESISFNAGGVTESGVDAQYGTNIFVGGSDSNFTISGVTLVGFTGDNFNLNGPNDLYVGHLILTGSSDPIASTDPTNSTDPGPTTPVAITPEPSSLLLLGTGLLGWAGLTRRRIV